MTHYSHLLTLGLLLLPLTITPVDGGGEEPEQPQQQTTTIDSKIVAIAVDYHAALLLACSDLIHRKDVPEVEKCAKYYLNRIIQAEKHNEGKEQ